MFKEVYADELRYNDVVELDGHAYLIEALDGDDLTVVLMCRGANGEYGVIPYLRSNVASVYVPNGK